MMEAENSNFHELIIGEKKRRLKAKIVMMPCADLTLTNSPQHEILDASKKSEDENPNSLFFYWWTLAIRLATDNEFPQLELSGARQSVRDSYPP